MARFTQEHRELAVATPLGEDVLLLSRMTVSEALGRPFEMRLRLLSEDVQIAFEDLVGQAVTVRMAREGDETRFFNGLVSRLVHTGFADAEDDRLLAVYEATVVPWLWFLTRSADCRIFQDMTVPDILKQVFRDHGFTDFQDALAGSYRTWDYCVQYRESAFNFVSRLMEQEGIYYFFEHENGKHTLVLADSYSSHAPVSGYEQVPYFPPGDRATRERDHLSQWSVEKHVQPGRYVLDDFDYVKPKTNLESKAQIDRSHAQSDFEMYDYPGEYVAASDGEAYAKVRIEELQTQHEVVHGWGDARGLMAGGLFELTDFPREDQNREYLVVEAMHEAESDPFQSSGGSGEATYSVQVSAIDARTPYRPARVTPKPMIQGPQTAFVVGQSGEEIYTDEHGRVKVQFHWDRYGKADENSSCWIRVAQTWAGKNWGAWFLPRIGHEVMVEFLEGDPDRPIVTGRVYNGDCKTPYGLPGEMTKSTIKSSSSKGGEGFNEIRFEDKKGEEQIFVHAEKNQDIRVKNDCFEWIGNNRHLVVKTDQFEHVENNRSEKVDADHKEEIGKDRHLKVKGKEAKAVDKSHSFTVKGDVIEVFKKNHSEETTKDYYLKASNVVIEGTSNVTIKVGGSHIAIEAGGIKIGTSGQIKIESSATTDIKASAPLTMQSSAITTVKGSLVKIN